MSDFLGQKGHVRLTFNCVRPQCQHVRYRADIEPPVVLDLLQLGVYSC